MGLFTVKRKFRPANILVAFAGLTFLVSVLGVLPAGLVEAAFSRGMFPTISHIFGRIADALPVSWLDVFVVAAVAILVAFVRWRQWRLMFATVAALYLVFFWSWGLNYHREDIETKLALRVDQVSQEQIDEFAQVIAAELNRLWPQTSTGGTTPEMVGQKAGERIRTVIAKLDGSDWQAASRIKQTRLVNPWFRAAGIEGMFNPIVHEPVIVRGLLPFELPFVMSHELAHVRGYPNEGDANFAALLATLSSDDLVFQYSGWFNLWLYVRSPELDALLADGPRLDLQLFFIRVEEQRVRWLTNFQTAVFDWFLKANDVDEGVRSYARIVNLAIASRDMWNDYR